MAHASSQYIHGTHEEEQARLARLNELINQPALAEMNLQGGERILDVGCGLGQFTRCMARLAGSNGRVLGIERSSEQLQRARDDASLAGESHLVEFRQGDAADLPLQPDEWGSFDVVHTRFLLEHVPQPLTIIKSMAKAARPGGRIILQDDGHDILRLYPEPPGFYGLWNAYIRSYDRLGNDPYIGHRLVWLLHQAGVTSRRNTWLFFGSCQGEAKFNDLTRNLIIILQGAQETIVRLDLMPDDQLNAALGSLETWASRSDAAIWYAISWAEGILNNQSPQLTPHHPSFST